jgi:hypothetical protein
MASTKPRPIRADKGTPLNESMGKENKHAR